MYYAKNKTYINIFLQIQKIVLISVIVFLVPQPCFAGTPKGKCPNYWKIYGLFMGSAMVCNFPENNAIRKTREAIISSCDINDKQMSERYVGDGIKQIHRDVSNKGHAKACAEMYEFMDRVGGSN